MNDVKVAELPYVSLVLFFLFTFREVVDTSRPSKSSSNLFVSHELQGIEKFCYDTILAKRINRANSFDSKARTT